MNDRNELAEDIQNQLGFIDSWLDEEGDLPEDNLLIVYFAVTAAAEYIAEVVGYHKMKNKTK